MNLSKACIHLMIFLSLTQISILKLSASPLENVKSWGYQLQDFSPLELINSGVDLLVIDYSKDGSEDLRLTKPEIDQIKNSGKLVIAYLSIGEAEEYRYYFKSRWIKKIKKGNCGRVLTEKAPSWLDAPNKQWCGNYKVRYWQKNWQKIIFGKTTSYLDKIISAGFDGVYLDIIDAFEYPKFVKEQKGKKNTAKLMSKLVKSISDYARVTKGLNNFIIIPQNGASIISKLSESEKKDYFDAIDGIGAEDTFYYGDLDENNNLDIQTETIGFLNEFYAGGKKVFAVDYLTDTSKINQFVSLACANSYIPFVSIRDLSSVPSLYSCN